MSIPLDQVSPYAFSGKGAPKPRVGRERRAHRRQDRGDKDGADAEADDDNNISLAGFFNAAKRGYSVAELAAAGPLSRSEIYSQIRLGRLIARKCGRRTLILPADWENFLRALPVMGVDEPAVEPASLRKARRARAHRTA